MSDGEELGDALGDWLGLEDVDTLGDWLGMSEGDDIECSSHFEAEID